MTNYTSLADLKTDFDGELYYTNQPADEAYKWVYATDASVYREKPHAVALPATVTDIKKLIAYANNHQITLIPRAAGTSLAGQVVGNGIVVDISKYFNKIVEVNAEERWVKVQPGVIRDDLNKHLKAFGLMFGPETSTANRAMIGGMVGNNSCGLHSIVWGSVRDHLLEAKVLLSNGDEVIFKEESLFNEFESPLKTNIYQRLQALIQKNSSLIKTSSPNEKVVRRNMGYALDSLINMQPFEQNGEPFNLCKMLAGSEGTLAFITEVKLQLLPLPSKEIALVCVHTKTLAEALWANNVALEHKPMASELVDKFIMDFTIGHPVYQHNRFFIDGDPEAILMVEFMAETNADVTLKANNLIAELTNKQLGYAYPILYNQETIKAWDIRKAGLGLLRNLPGDAQPVNLIEDCAVAPNDLPNYVAEIADMLQRNGTRAAYYAHAGAGELHIEPIINLKTHDGVVLFRKILEETVEIVKKYNGSISGEHGDGRLRGEFIPLAVGEDMYTLFKEVKCIFDPNGIFNKGKIVDAPPMDVSLRVSTQQASPQLDTYFDFSKDGGLLRLAEKCSGSGDCRKSHLSGGTMCPSYMATKNEKDTTRARANILREFLSNPSKNQHLAHEEIHKVLDLCLSCKACKTECPSAVDMAKMKAEFLQHYYQKKGIPARSKLIANYSKQMKLAAKIPRIYNYLMGSEFWRTKLNRLIGFHPLRSMPLLPKESFSRWFEKYQPANLSKRGKEVILLIDEFTQFADASIGKTALLLLEHLGYKVTVLQNIESGRTYLSKGLVKEAKILINKNIQQLADVVTENIPVVGVEPSAILTLRDEYLDLCNPELKQKAKGLAKQVFTIEEFLAAEYFAGHIQSAQFTNASAKVVLHAHCYQKALSLSAFSKTILSIPTNYLVDEIPSGCCGMAGSFGYEAEHFDVSNQIGELVLFPFVRIQTSATLIAAAGTSCRHQIKDGTGRIANHPVEILWNALLK